METFAWLYSYFRYAFEKTYTKEIVHTFIDFIGQLGLFIIGGIFLATVLTLYFPKNRIAGSINRGHGLLAIGIAVILGAISPVGTYALIPLVGALLKDDNFPVPPLMAFLIASPLINPFLFFLTTGAFGMELAMMRFSSALILGLTGGLVAKALWKSGDSGLPVILTQEKAETKSKKTFIHDFKSEFFKQSRFIIKIFLISVLTASVVKVIVPPDLIGKLVGGNAYVSVLVAVAAGIPLYSCGGGNIPVMQALYELGMNKGAILAFFISGPATKVSTVAALVACMKRPVLILYFSITVIGAFIFGIVYNLV
jgi:uncharacterized membrane protein YraQ (UPF0718 family)